MRKKTAVSKGLTCQKTKKNICKNASSAKKVNINELNERIRASKVFRL